MSWKHVLSTYFLNIPPNAPSIVWARIALSHYGTTGAPEWVGLPGRVPVIFEGSKEKKFKYRDSLIYAASIYADLIYADVWILSVPWFTRFYSLNYTDFLKGKLNILYFGGKVAWILFFPWVPLQESGTHGLELLKRPLNLVILNGRMFILMYREFSYSVDFWDWSKKLC